MRLERARARESGAPYRRGRLGAAGVEGVESLA